MNSSLQRVCASRGRMIHRSKDLVMVELFPGGPKFPQVSPARGATFDVGINNLKRLPRMAGLRLSRERRDALWEKYGVR